MDTIAQGQKQPLESLSKEEIIQKYKGLLGIAKKAKQAKDVIFEENRKLKEQLQLYETQKEEDKKVLMTTKEMLHAITESKLQLTTELADLQKQRKLELENVEKFSIENESLKRQIQRLMQDNDSLLTNIENMESQLKQVSDLGRNQKQHLDLQEKEIKKFKEIEDTNLELKLKNDELSQELEELKEKYKFIKDINTEQRYKLNSLKDRFFKVHKKLKKLKECKRILLETQHEYADSVSQWQNEIVKASRILCREMNNLKEENIKLLQQVNRGSISDRKSDMVGNFVSVDKLNELLHLSEKAKDDYINLQEENVKIKQNTSINSAEPSALFLEKCINRLDEMFLLTKTAFHEYNDIQEENVKLKVNTKTLTNLDQMNSKIGVDKFYNIVLKLEELQNLATKANEDYQCQTKKLKKLKQDYVRLTNTSDKIGNIIQKENVEEKQRSENLCSQLEKMSEEKRVLEENLNEFESLLNIKDQLLSTQHSVEDYQKLYKQKEIEQRELLDEMRELNEALKARGDLISRQQEEHQVLKTELEACTEKLAEVQQDIEKKDIQLKDKYKELETLTKEIKLTKQKLEISERSSTSNEEKVKILSMELENMKLNLITSNDPHNQSDVPSTSTISKADERQRQNDIEDSLNKTSKLVAKIKEKIQDDGPLKEKLEKDIQDFKRNENELNAQIREFKSKMYDMEPLQKQLHEKQKHIDSLKAENQKLKSSCKQANVLNLEIEAAEKSLTEVTNKLVNRTSELDAAQESLRSKEETIIQLHKEINFLELAKTAEIKHSQELKEQIDHLHKTIKDEMHSKQQAYDKIKVLEQDVENLKLKLESVGKECAESNKNLETQCEFLNFEREELFMYFSTSMSSLAACERKLEQTERDIKNLRAEYLDYKIKAQAVLKKNQNHDSSKERELEEELVSIRAVETQLNATIQTLTTRIETLEKEKELLADDNMSLQKRSKELMELIEDIRNQNNSLNQQIQQHIQQQHETLKQHHQQIESIDNYHKEYTQSLNASHQRQLEQLRKELSTHIRLPPTIGATKSVPSHTPIDQSKVDFLMEREVGEGSEEAAETLTNLAAFRKISNDSSSTKRSLHDFMPLDELLNTPINAINSETLITTSQEQQQHYITETSMDTNNSAAVLQLELNTTKERLQKQESRVRHLTALLAENEQDLAKLTQMNDMLKEELRRQERSVEREQHMHNSEYVKNVIMKFLTLNNADEKTRLVPVINTILKLSRSETEMLNCVAKGQKVCETAQRTEGWSNFLPWGNSSNNN